MVADPCNPLAGLPLPTETTAPHHISHHVIGRIHHHFRHQVEQLRQPASPVTDGCGRAEGMPGQHGVLPATPAGRVASGIPGGGLAPKAALLGGGAAKAAALGLASLAGVASVGALLPSAIQPARPLIATSPSLGLPGHGSAPGPTLGVLPSSLVSPPASVQPPPGNTAVPEPSSASLLMLAIAAALTARRFLGQRVRER
jgi:hypothetical protein